MARRRNQAIHTVYHALENAGKFDDNPANHFADPERDGQPFRTWPVRYPMVLYHPKGERRVIRAAQYEQTPFGPRMVNKHEEVITAVATNEAEEKRLRAAGWHDHPMKAEAAAGRAEVVITAEQKVQDLEGEIAKLRAEREALMAQALVAQPNVPVAPGTVLNADKALKLQDAQTKADAAAAPKAGYSGPALTA